MENLSVSWNSATVVDRAPSSKDRSQSPISRSPVPKAGDTPTLVAFRNARDTYRKSLSEKDLKRIMIPTRPEDVVNEIEKWHKRHLNNKVAAGVRSGLGQLQRFSASIDMLAQGTPSPGCLLWGSIKFVLTLVQDAVQAYEQLCKALVRMIDCLPRIEIYTETFLESSLVADCVNAFYVSTIRFWAKACKFYSRRRLWKILRVLWNDFDTEFGDLEADMIRNRDRVEGAALAEHIGESKAAKVSQQNVNFELLEAQGAIRRKDITAWLAPVAYDVEYFSNDLASARALRHPKTCIWILRKPEVMQLCDGSHTPEKLLLWICANPGAGKTVLSSFLIDHFESKESDPLGQNVLYFFCKNNDADKNTSTAVIRSLLYQLFKSVKDQRAWQSLYDDLGLALDRSGQQRAVNFAVLWQLFCTHVTSLTPTTIILDALDECQDPNQLIECLKEVSELRSIKVIVTSRKELHLYDELKDASSIEIAPEDIDADIAAFVEAKVEASSQLSHPLVRELVITKLCSAHDGMFLWVYLVLKELKSCISMAQVQDALAKLPTGLDGIYKSILRRLQTTLTRPSFDLCSKVLTWVVSAVRPLGVHEIRQALTLHYDMDGDTLLTDDQSFPYSDKDVELICGSLITIRKGTLQVIHLTVKEFLRAPQENGGPTSSSLLVDPEHASRQLTLVCLRCIANYAKPWVNLESKAPHIDWTLDPGTLERCQARASLLEYASFSWPVHLIDSKPDDLLKITPTFKKTFNSPATFSWVEMCMTLQPDSTLRLLVGFDEIHDRFYGSRTELQTLQDASSQFLASWCAAMSQVFEEYGAILARRPWEIYLIDLHDIYGADSSLQKLWHAYGETSLREKDLHLDGYRASRPPQEKPQPHLQLQKNLQFEPLRPDSIFLVHDEGRNIYIWGETVIEGNYHCISVQHDETGQRLPPAEDFSVESGQKWRLRDLAMSPNGKFLVLFFRSETLMSGLTIAWRINEDVSFRRRMNCEPWARVVFSHVSNYAPLDDHSGAILFKDNNYCVTPIGTLDLLKGSRQPLPNSVLEWIDLTIGLFYSCDGRYLYASGNHEQFVQARRVDLFEPSDSVDFCWEDKRRLLVNVSPTGRYLVLGPSESDFAPDREEEILYLYDTNSNETIQLPLPEPLHYWNGKFSFSRGDTRLTSFLFGWPNELNVIIWNCLETAPRLTSHVKLDRDSLTRPHQIYVHNGAISAVMVTNTRSIQRIELGDSILFLDASKLIDEYPHRLSTISQDGSRWAFLSYGRKGGILRTLNLTSPDAPTHYLDLEWSQSDIPDILTHGLDPPIGISPDLRVLVINAEVFDLTTTKMEGPSKRSTLTPFTIEGLPTLLKPHRHRITSWGLDCRISPCQSYVMYVGRGDQWGNTARYSSAIFLYRLNLQEKTSTRLDITLPERLISLEASFHPSLPLMIISYGSSTMSELEPFEATPPPLRLAICDLNSLELTFLQLPEGQTTEALAESWGNCGFLPRLLFSSCGTFAYLEGRARREIWWFQRVHRMDISPVHSQFIDNSLSLDNSLVVFYDQDNAAVALELIKLDKNGFWKGTRPVVMLDNIASYSSHFVTADRHFLIGANDDEKMRLLIAPHDDRAPVIKTLSLTFAEARSRLQKEWERVHETSQDIGSGTIIETASA